MTTSKHRRRAPGGQGTCRRAVTAAAAIVVLLTSCSDDSPAPPAAEASEPEPIRPGRATWSTGYFQAALYAELLAELGHEVESPARHEYPPKEAYAAMARGEFDFWPNGWFPQHETYYGDELGDGSLVGDHVAAFGSEIPDGGLEGLVITRSIADQHGIVSLDQIDGDPDLVALFDTDGDGRAEVRGCPESWTCDDIIDDTIAFNDWTNLEQVQAGYDGLIADTIERVTRGEPVIQYVWSPSGYLVDLLPGENVYWLDLGGPDKVIDGTTPVAIDYSDAAPAPPAVPCTGDPCWMGWEVADIQITAATSFVDAHPDARALFEVVELTVADVAEQNERYAAGEDSEADVERHAQEWIDAHRDLVDEWLETARAAT